MARRCTALIPALYYQAPNNARWIRIRARYMQVSNPKNAISAARPPEIKALHI
jgi:hypothetical protein